MLAEVRADYLMPYIKSIMQFMLLATQDTDESVALEACEFWSAIAELKLSRDALLELLPTYVQSYSYSYDMTSIPDLLNVSSSL